MEISTIGEFEIELTVSNAPVTTRAFSELAKIQALGSVHRAEPRADNEGPPYSLIQSTVDDPFENLDRLKHEGSLPVQRGAVVHICCRF